MRKCDLAFVNQRLDSEAGRYRWQLEGAGAPLKRSFIQLMVVGALSRAAKMCDTPGSSTKLTRTPCLHRASAKRFVTCGSTVVSAVPCAMKTGAPAEA